MVKRAPQMIPQLRRKLSMLYAHSRTIRAARDFAANMGVQQSTVSGWLNGVKGKPGGLVPADVLDRLSRLLVVELSVRISQDEAKALWHGPYEEFEAALLKRPSLDFLAVVARGTAKLPVRQVIHDPSSLGMIADAIDIPGHATRIQCRCGLAFEIDGQIGRSLIVLGEEPAGWRVLAPGRHHPGSIDAPPERLPNSRPGLLYFKEPLGPHRFIFLEHPKDMVPAVPVPSISAIPSSALGELARQLSDPRWAGHWRWAEAVFDVVP